MSTDKRYFDIAVVIPLEEELQQFLNIFEEKEDLSTLDRVVFEVDSGATDVTILVTKQQEMGKAAALNSAEFFTESYNVGMLICLGIGGSLSSDLELADVCYSSKVFDVLENSKADSNKEGGLELSFSPNHYATHIEITAALDFVRIKKNLKPLYENWQLTRGVEAEQHLPEELPSHGGRLKKVGIPKAISGTIACASVSKNKEYNEKLLEVDRKTLVVETESGGVFASASKHQIPALTIRGISDHADGEKNKLENDTGGMVRTLAAANAVSFLKCQLSNSEFLGFIQRLKTPVENRHKLEKLATPRTPTQHVGDAARLIDEKLRELCPEYKLQPKGYQLPIPRIINSTENDVLAGSREDSPTEVLDALGGNDSLFIKLNHTYPDDSLPHVIAANLLAKVLDEREIIPCVIDAGKVSPPKSGFEALTDLDLMQIHSSEEMQLVFVVDKLPVHSKSRMDFLNNEISKFPDAKFVFISKSQGKMLEISEFIQQTGSASFNLGNISFSELVHFLEKNFEMETAAAEVVALRLERTFDRFNLRAHPTYFAGIPIETLTALLQANRRSELIQLGVDGFLTFLVAGDRADVTLSRTTRARFLQILAKEMNIEKKNFNTKELIGLTESIAKEFDYDIRPLDFINAFIDNGILHFDQNENIAFSLPFIESYLLAKALAESSALASRYFQFSNEEFDGATFDIYCEIGASDEIVRELNLLLESSIEELQHGDEEHILVSDRVRPAITRQQGKLDGLQKRIRRAVENVRSDTKNSKSKQQILDVAERVRIETNADTRKKLDENESSSLVGQSIQFEEAIAYWTQAVVLLGCGAEHLTADTKRNLADMLVRLGSLIVHHWTVLNLSIDFEQIKGPMLNPESISEIAKQLGEDDEETRKFVALLVDAMEYSSLATPFMKLSGYLCEHARHRVLAKSVENSRFSDKFDGVLHGIWLADIETKKGSDILNAAAKELPLSTFLRTNLVTHLMSRVHWSHSDKLDRLALLDSAEQIMKPLMGSLDKSKILREINRSAKASSNT
ncbi:hypothetical protein [Maritalea porphyrae]|uniref:phosphorylase family protein n=1 Tax=Maritalea porphyrae TaxID=880732 RepID=UPI0022AF1D9A|nr:hypothetical protein [Maritalea porphyrae]MCZ4272026.1 hypothetical protein [Maritalea porphyrae]